MIAPRRLSTSPYSPYYDKDAISAVDKVFVDGAHLPNCRAYDIDAGWAAALENGSYKPKIYGVIAVLMK